MQVIQAPSPTLADFNNHVNASTSVHSIANMANLLRAFGGVRELFTNLDNKSGATTIDISTANMQQVTLTGNVTFTFSNTNVTMDASHVFSFVLRVVQDGTGARTVTWPGTVTWMTGNPSVNPTASAVTQFAFYSQDGAATWYGFQQTIKATVWDNQLLPFGTTPIGFNSSAVTVADTLYLQRCPVLTAGTIYDISVGAAVWSGNCEVSVYKLASGTWTKLYASGNVATGGFTANTWTAIVSGTTGITVNIGDDIGLGVAFDNATADVFRRTMNNVEGFALPTGYLGNGSVRTASSVAASRPAPATIADASLSNNNARGIIARIV